MLDLLRYRVRTRYLSKSPNVDVLLLTAASFGVFVQGCETAETDILNGSTIVRGPRGVPPSDLELRQLGRLPVLPTWASGIHCSRTCRLMMITSVTSETFGTSRQAIARRDRTLVRLPVVLFIRLLHLFSRIVVHTLVGCPNRSQIFAMVSWLSWRCMVGDMCHRGVMWTK